MRIGVMIGEEVLGQHADLKGLLHHARQAEERGFASAWVPHIFGVDAITALAIVGRETQRIELGTAVIPTFTRHPFTLAQQALTVKGPRGPQTLRSWETRQPSRQSCADSPILV